MHSVVVIEKMLPTQSKNLTSVDTLGGVVATGAVVHAVRVATVAIAAIANMFERIFLESPYIL